jgi:riboflavin synthase
MFTGLVQTIGSVTSIQEEGDARRLVVRDATIAPEIKVGDSIAVDGACLTVTEVAGCLFAFQAGPETLQKTNLGELRPGDAANLERALRVGDPLGGHWVQGHVDGVGRILSREAQGEWETVWIECPPNLAAQMIPKGSITVDGVSLTLVEVAPNRFSVALIPHTLTMTTLGRKRPGATVNLETDVLGKYVWKYLETLGQLTRS